VAAALARTGGEVLIREQVRATVYTRGRPRRAEPGGPPVP
jgi:hypothetical protein